MKKTIIALAAMAFAAPALAGGSNAGISANANINAGVNAETRGPSASAIANANGQFSTDRDFGRARAEERMSAQGLLHGRGPSTDEKKRQRKPDTPRAVIEGSAGAEAILNRR